MASKRPNLKRVFSGIPLTTNDVRSIAFHAAQAGEVDLRANGARLMAIDQVDQVIVEDIVLDRLSITVAAREGSLEMVYEPGAILVRADEEALSLRAPFEAIVALLAAKTNTGFGRNSMEVSPPGTWREPAMPRAAAAPAAAAKPASSHRASASPRRGALRRWWNSLPFNRTRTR
jgi:hypothetical protein